MRAVYWRAREAGRNEHEAAIMIINADQDDPLLACFDGKAAAPQATAKKAKKKRTSRAHFLHKSLIANNNTSTGMNDYVIVHQDQEPLAALSPDMFFDPRDI